MSQDDIYYEEAVIFYHWLMYCQPRPIEYPLNEGLWIHVCSFGLRSVLESFLLEAEYQQWLRYRASAQRQLGERFLEDDGCKNLRRSPDEQVEDSRKHWNI
jgi:hypothetical protein